MLTQTDYDEVEELVRKVVKEETGHLPSKDDFYKETARLLSKMEDIEDSITILNNRTSDHSDKLEKLEKIHPQYAHASV